MERVVIWGLADEFTYWKRMIECIDDKFYQIVAYCDRDPKKREQFHEAVAPFALWGLQFDIVITCTKIKNQIRTELMNNGFAEEINIYTFEEFIYKMLRVHPKAAGNVICMDRYCREVLKRTDFHVSSIMEIGANYGQDAEFLRVFWGVDSKNVYTFEANPEFSKEIDRRYQYNNYNYAVSDHSGTAVLNIVAPEEGNSGLSTLKNYEHVKGWKKIEVKCICMKDFLDDCNMGDIKNIDFLKLDVEGVNYEVLKGFGDYLNHVSIVQTEAENLIEYEGKHYLFNDIAILLMNYGFELVCYDLGRAQSDSLWIKSDLLKKRKL